MDRPTAITIASAVVAAKKAAEKAVAAKLQQSPGRARALSVDDCEASLEKEAGKNAAVWNQIFSITSGGGTNVLV